MSDAGHVRLGEPVPVATSTAGTRGYLDILVALFQRLADVAHELQRDRNGVPSANGAGSRRDAQEQFFGGADLRRTSKVGVDQRVHQTRRWRHAVPRLCIGRKLDRFGAPLL